MKDLLVDLMLHYGESDDDQSSDD
ncbi:hypothetical protein RDI58_001425 [Solanum bulbocastanum]|uniref:Uncharacterized protein n=1 Tax=Solanum bulbocastanum TaxID=147425 RepID=A0AAN8YQ72_SOLBU